MVDVGFTVYYPVYPEFSVMKKLEADSPDMQRSVTVLPWYRRCEVNISSLPITIAGGAFDVTVANEQIVRAIDAVGTRIQQDPESWRLPDNRSSIDAQVKALRTPEDYAAEIILISAGTSPSIPPWDIRLQIQQYDERGEGAMHLRALLVNVANVPADFSRGAGDLNIYDASIRLRMSDTKILPYEFLLAPKDYRISPVLSARGINCSVTDASDGDDAILETETLPIYEQALYRTRESVDISFEKLQGDHFDLVLASIEREMEKYLLAWDHFLQDGAGEMNEAHVHECLADRNKFAAELDRYRLGRECLQRNSTLRRAFQLMNAAFGTLAERSGGRMRAWRLFQIGFIVSQLPAISIRNGADVPDEAFLRRLKEAHLSVGILWFPTGGGKTEAYLGLIAASMLFDRLSGKLRGVNTWMRFPLRMLSLQQLDRMARVVAVLNEMRAVEREIAGGDEFAIGYYIGTSSSPNRVSSAEAELLTNDTSRRARNRQLMKCPHCRSRVDVQWRKATWRLAHVCSNPACFSNVERSRGERRGTLPLYIVDDEIYRYLPAVLVGTVDKLASAVLRREFAAFIGGVDAACPIHGYVSYEKCIVRDCAERASAYSRLPPSVNAGPTFLVQDEFHLLRDELGVFAGHYEGLLQVLLRYGGGLPPKILAATATIEAYENQAFQIYLKDAVRYPESGWESGESFYATSSPPIHRRSYVGVLGHTRTIEEVALRIETLYISEVRRLKESPGECAMIMEVARDHGGIQSTLRLYDLLLTYVTKKPHAGAIKDKQRVVEEHLERLGLGSIECTVLTGDSDSEAIGDVIDRIEREIDDLGASRLDLVIATNLISHGVDLERINCMTVTGTPSHYAEYVQCSSRCARSHPGSIFVCFRSSDPREASQYQSFYAMHAHMERLIEPVAVNRFSSFAPVKTIPGMLVGTLLALESPKLYRERRIGKSLDDLKAAQIALGFESSSAGTERGSVDRAEVGEIIAEAIGVDRVHPPALPSEVERLGITVENQVELSIAAVGRSMDRYIGEALHCLQSFRDVDEGVRFSTLDSMELLTRVEG